jgi:hypothetical protein
LESDYLGKQERRITIAFDRMSQKRPFMAQLISVSKTTLFGTVLQKSEI